MIKSTIQQNNKNKSGKKVVKFDNFFPKQANCLKYLDE